MIRNIAHRDIETRLEFLRLSDAQEFLIGRVIVLFIVWVDGHNEVPSFTSQMWRARALVVMTSSF